MAHNEDNLVPQNKRTKEEQRLIATAGGIASGEARRRKRTLRQIAEMLAEKQVQVSNPDGTREQVTMDVALVQRQYQKAVMEGDTTAAKFIGELLGELKPAGSVENGAVQIVVSGNDTAAALAKIVGNENNENL